MIDTILAAMFPPSLKLLGRVWVIDEEEFDEQGACGKAQRKRYKNGIERTLAEEAAHDYICVVASAEFSAYSH